jgi:phosphopentomutase
MKRIFLIVLDSCGVGYEPDAADFGDVGADTLRACAKSPEFNMDNLVSMGLGGLDGVDYLPKADRPQMAVARLRELSRGKDTTIGHWEIAGIVSPKPLPTYPDGFPEEVLQPFREATGRGVLCNKPYSGTEVIKDYGRRHVETGDLIVYTSADSVFQIAAHENVVPPDTLYEYCRAARKILTGRHGVGRVIARPFAGDWPYTRTPRRHDFSLDPPGETMLDAVQKAGQQVLAVGKIHDIFAGRGMTEFTYTAGNTDGLAKTLALADRDFRGLCFVNLVDFDMLYGHRRNPDGYARALHEFDAWLPGFLKKLGPDDLAILTADHGCDPTYMKHTDHTREYIPMLALGERVNPVNLGTRPGFCDIAATVTELLGVPFATPGKSFAKEILK